MSKRGNTIAAVASLGVLALGWTVTTGNAASQASNPTTTTQQTAQATQEDTQNGTATENGTATQDSDSTATQSADTNTGSNTNASGYADGTYTGQTATHRFGSVTVTVTISGGKITEVSENVVSDGDRKSDMINSRAVPVVREEVLSANSADVSTVSGATYTTRAYLDSLQSALDQAKG